jgi:hypothetical protein
MPQGKRDFDDWYSKKKTKHGSAEEINAIRRLKKDMKELAMSAGEYPLVSAVPIEENIFYWHANISVNLIKSSFLFFCVLYIFFLGCVLRPQSKNTKPELSTKLFLFFILFCSVVL